MMGYLLFSNAAIRASVRTAHYLGLKVFGCYSGYQGLVEQVLFPLEPESVANCIQHGGTILKADRCLAFYEKSTRDQCRALPLVRLRRQRQNISK